MTDALHNVSTTPAQSKYRWRRFAWIVILLSDIGFIAWGAAAALFLEHLLGPGGVPILPAGYEGFTGESWQVLVASTPHTTDFITILFRLYGAFNVAFALMAAAITITAFRRGETWAWWALLVGNTIAYSSAMTYDRLVNAIGPFEMMEYVGIIAVYIALAVTKPFGSTARRRPSQEESSQSILDKR